jgi:hypothetical protein
MSFSSNWRKTIGHKRLSGAIRFAPVPDYGYWRKAIGPTVRVRPMILRHVGENTSSIFGWKMIV